MDPNATLRSLVEAIEDREMTLANAHMHSLNQWIKLDGFTPKLNREEQVS